VFAEGQRVKIVKITGRADRQTQSLIGKEGYVDFISSSPNYPIAVDVSQVSHLNVWWFNEDELEIV
jgi:hypothetical protein